MKRSAQIRRNLLHAALGLAFSHYITDGCAQGLPVAPDQRNTCAGSEEKLLSVTLNNRQVSDFSRMLWLAGRPYATADEWGKWRLHRPDEPDLICRGEIYYALFRLPRLHWSFDPGRQALMLQAPATAFAATDLLAGGNAPRIEPAQPEPGAFFNYNAQLTHALGSNMANGTYELGLFSDRGLLTSRFIQRDIPGLSHWLRLDTSYTLDNPDRMQTLRLGDNIARPSAWGKQFYYGGVQWGTNFATNPYFLPMPLPSLSGVAVQPSTVDLYVNNSLRYSHDLDTGPFDINQVPVITGAGEMRMVVRDLAGRQQIISVPYYASPALLKPGLHDFGYESGLLRQNMGTTSNDYQQGFVTATHRYGVTDHLTIEGRGELSQATATVGGGLQYLLGSIGVIGGGMAESKSNTSAGRLLYVQLDHKTGQLSFGGQIQSATQGFYQLGMLKGELPAHLQVQSYVSFPVIRQDALSLGYIYRANRSQPSNKLLSISYSLPVRKDYAMSLGGFRTLLPDRQWGMSITLSHTFGGGRLATGSVNMEANGQPQAMLDLSKPLPVGDGFGYHLRTENNGGGLLSADLQYQNDMGIYSADISGASNAQVTVEGGIVMMHGHTVMSRPVTNSFAMVEVPDHPDAQIFANNQAVVRTNSQGIALVTNLAPYVNNKINVDDRGMPVDTLLDMQDRQVAPYARSGVYLRFDAHKNTGAVIRLTDAEGADLPPGASVRLANAKSSYATALRGEVYVTDLQLPTTLTADWEGYHCEVAIPYMQLPPLPRVGPLICGERREAAARH